MQLNRCQFRGVSTTNSNRLKAALGQKRVQKQRSIWCSSTASIDTAPTVDAAASGDRLLVRFALPYKTSPGEVVKLVGGDDAFGQWDAAKGCELTWSDGHVWVADVQLEAGKLYEFKGVIVNAGSKSEKWESGGNRSLQVPPSAADVVTVACTWANTAAMPMDIGRGGPAEASSSKAADSAVAAAGVEKQMARATVSAATAAAVKVPVQAGAGESSAAAEPLAPVAGDSRDAQAAAAPAVPEGRVMVRFSMQYATSLGQVVKLVGGSDEMGQWKVGNALKLQWTPGNVWVGSAPLLAGQRYEFKAMMLNKNTGEQKWEDGGNRCLQVPESGAAALTVNCSWGAADAMRLEAEAPEEPSLKPAAVNDNLEKRSSENAKSGLAAAAAAAKAPLVSSLPAASAAAAAERGVAQSGTKEAKSGGGPGVAVAAVLAAMLLASGATLYVMNGRPVLEQLSVSLQDVQGGLAAGLQAGKDGLAAGTQKLSQAAAAALKERQLLTAPPLSAHERSS